MADPLREARRGDNNVTQADALLFLDRYAEADRAVNEAVADRNRLRKEIRSAGIPLAPFDRSRKDASISGELRQSYTVWYERLMAWQSKPVGFQSSLDLKTDDANLAALNVHEHKRMDNEGFDAGKSGRRRDSNPYNPGSEHHQRWDSAWMRGQAEIADTLKPAAPARSGRKKAEARPTPAANGQRRGRGRPKNSKNRPKLGAVDGQPASETPPAPEQSSESPGSDAVH